MDASLTMASPSVTVPSTGIREPARTRMRSPADSAPMGTDSSAPSPFTRHTVSTWIARLWRREVWVRLRV